MTDGISAPELTFRNESYTESRSHHLKVDLVIKLGGAAITEKSKLETLNEHSLQQVAHLVLQIHLSGKTVVLVHGAGSFGHHAARQHSVHLGFPHSSRHGFSETRSSVTLLSNHVIKALTGAGLPCVACSPFPEWRTSGLAVTDWPSGTIEAVLRARLIPVLHGDCVLDDQQGCCVLSGDAIAVTLCGHFSVEKVLFLTDVDGVFSKPPGQSGASLVKIISSLSTSGNLLGDIHASVSDYDVTGGMFGKVMLAMDISARCMGRTKVYVARVGSEDAEKICLMDEGSVVNLNCTEFVYDVTW